MNTRRDFVGRLAALTAAAAGAAPFPSFAQHQIKQAKIICGFPPGGTSDLLSRRLAERLTGNYANVVLVENKAGAAGQIAVTATKESNPDGSAMLVTPSSMLSIYPYVYKALPYKPLVDVAPVSLAAMFNHAFGVGPAVPASVRTIRDFLTWAKAHPENANYGSPGSGSIPHLIGTLISKFSGIDLRHIPYRGSAPGIQELMGGQISAMSCPVGEFLPHLKTGRVRLLAISGLNRSPFVPDVPTLRQQGMPSSVREWFGVFLPWRAAPDVVRRAAAYLQPILGQQDLQVSMAQFGMEMQSSSPQALTDLLHSDAEEWRRLIKQIGFTPES